MENPDNTLSDLKKKELINTAVKIIENATNPIGAIRKICILRLDMENPDDDVFIPLRAIESETDHFPIGKDRSLYAESYLQRLDLEMENYLKDTMGDIVGYCKKIISKYSSEPLE